MPDATVGRCAACDWTTSGPTWEHVDNELLTHHQAEHKPATCDALDCDHEATDRLWCARHAQAVRDWQRRTGGGRG